MVLQETVTTRGCSGSQAALVFAMKHKYERILEPTDTWAIFEIASGEPASIDDRLLIGLTESEADELLATLNAEPKTRNKRSAA